MAAIEALRARRERLVVIRVSGRPLIVTAWLDLVDGLVAAWLPGMEGQGAADVLFGDTPFIGTLSFTWPQPRDQIPFHLQHPAARSPCSPLDPCG